MAPKVNKFKILNSITEIPPHAWNDLFGPKLEGYNFYKTLENSKLPGFTFLYLAAYQEKDIVFIAPLFIKRLDLTISAEGNLRKIIIFLRKLYPSLLEMKTLFCGSPFAENGSLGIRKENKKEVELLIDAALPVLFNLCKNNKIPLIVFKDFLEKDKPFLNSLLKWNFFRLNSLPSSFVKLNFSSLEGYFKTLSYSSRKSLKRKIKQAYKRAEIKVKVLSDIRSEIGEIYRLYLNTYHAGKIKFEKLTPDFFANIAENLKGRAKFFLYYVKPYSCKEKGKNTSSLDNLINSSFSGFLRQEAKLAAFELCLVKDSLFIDKFIGFDYNISRKYNLYFVSFILNLSWCLRNNIRHYQLGQTDYRPKFQIGAELTPLYVYIRHRNNFLNYFLKVLSRFLSTSYSEQ